MNGTGNQSPGINTALGLSLILGLALTVDTFFFTGFFANADDNCLILAAHRMVNGQPFWQAEDPRTYLASAFRLALVLPAALLYYLGRGRIFWVAYGHIAYHLALIPLAYLLGRMLHERRTGLLAALLVALNPLFYAYAGACLPDNALSLWLGLATLALLHVHQQRERLSARPIFFPLLLIGAGFCVGLGYSCKETGLLMLPPAALILARTGPGIFSRQVLGNALAFALGFVAFLGLEQAILHALTGRWIWRWDIIVQAQGHYLERATVDGLLFGSRATRAAEELNRFAWMTGWTVLAGMLAYPWLKVANRLLWLIPAWFFIYLTFGSTSPWRYVPAAIMDRYFAVAMLPAMVMLARVAEQAGQWIGPRFSGGWGRGAAYACLALPAVLALVEMHGNLEGAGEIYRARQVRSFIEALETARVLRPGQPVVLSQALSDRMLALFLQDRDKVILRNSLYHHFRDAVPKPPFVYLGDNEVADPPSLKLDLPPRESGPPYEAKLWKIVKPGFSRYDTLLQGNSLAGLNPILAGRRIRQGGALDTYIVLVEPGQP